MASWERECYANPGELIHWPQRVRLHRPLFFTPAPCGNDIIDDMDVEEVCTVEPNTRLLIIASFPTTKDRGAVILVPHRGLWWWAWP